MDLRSDRLRLRRLSFDDAAFVLRLLNEDSFVQNIGDRGVRTLAQAHEYLRAGPLASYARHGHGLYLASLAEGPAIGLCGLVRREGLEHPDLGYALLPEFTGQGFALEAGRATLEHGHVELGMPTIQAVVMPGNARSIRVLERLGFVAIGTVALRDEGPADRLFGHVSASSAGTAR
ncbi:GNAT family N-acetyltransferase [Nannocystaceae bacterium ST9]